MQIWSAQRKPEPLHLLTQQRKVQILFFYQERDFIGYPHVQGMYAKTHEWTRNEGMFLNSVIKSILRGRYDFIRKMTRAEMLKLKVKLPAVIQADGTYIPDWAYMGTYMSEVMQKCGDLL